METKNEITVYIRGVCFVYYVDFSHPHNLWAVSNEEYACGFPIHHNFYPGEIFTWKWLPRTNIRELRKRAT